MNWRGLLIQLRTEAGVSQRRLSLLSGVHRSMIRRFEGGRAIPDVVKLEHLLLALGYELDVLPVLRKAD